MDFIQPFAAVVLVLALLGGALWLLRRRGSATFQLPGALMRAGRAQTRQMVVVERVALSAQHALHLVKIGEQAFLISTSPSSCGLVAEVDQ